MPEDTRIVCGAVCTWWDSIDKVGRLGTGSMGPLPCCPHCKGVLYEYPDEETWWRGVEDYTSKHPDYRKFIEWCRGKCFPRLSDAARSFREEFPQDQKIGW